MLNSLLTRLRKFLEDLSLQKAIALALIIGLAVPVGISALVTVTERRATLLERLRHDHARIVDALASGMQTPLWEIRPDAGRPLLEALMLDERVTLISVTSPLVPHFLEVEAPQQRLGKALSLERPVLHGEEEIGRVRVDMDTGQLETQLAVQWGQTLITGLLQLVSGMLIIFALLRYKVLAPLQRLVGQSEAFAAGTLDRSWTWRRGDELGVLGRSFEKMRQSLSGLIADLEKRNQDLQEARRKADETRQLLEAVMDAVPAMLHVKDREFRYRMVNREFLECWGFKREEFLGKTSHDMFPEGMSRFVESRDRQVLETGRPLPFSEISYQGNRAEPITVWSTKVPLVDADGKVTHIVTVDVDISERKRAEQERQRWAQLLHDAIESIPNGFAVYDASQYLVICNTAFASLYGRTAEALVGMKFTELASRFLEQVQSLDDHSPETVKQKLSLNLYWAAPNKSVEVQLKDGCWFLVNRHPTVEGGIVFVRTDITHLKRMEQQLRESEQRFRTIAETHPVPSVILSRKDQRLLYASPGFATLCRAPLSDIASLAPDSFYVDPADRDYLLEELTATGFVEAYEMTMRRPDGSTVDVSISARPITYQGEDAVLASILDLTERKRADAELLRHREALHQSEKLSALGSLLAGIAHELNNPLSVVVGRAIMLEERLRGSDIAASIAKIRAAAERCARIVKTFLAMARRQELARAPVHIQDVIESSLDLVSYGLRATGIEISMDMEPDLPELMADPDQLIQVFTNLFVNAQQAMAHTSQPRRLGVSVRLDAAANALRIRVSDTGPGIPKEILPRIFEPFFTTKPVGEGTGFGLSISQGIVEAHGGTISVDLPASGGTAFEISLPVEECGKETVVETEAVTAETNSRRILIVDDVPEIAQLLADILADEGHHIEVAGHGRAALEYLDQQDFDLIMSDLRMPDLDGPGLYAELQSRNPRLIDRLIFITGDTLSENIREFLEKTGRPVIEKPFVPDEIRRMVAQTLEQALVH